MGALPRGQKSRRRRNRVTIAAGFKCEGGIVLCADTQETSGDIKLSVQKLVRYEREWCQAGLAGSGWNGILIDTLIQNIMHALDRGYDDIGRIEQAISHTLARFYRRDISLHPNLDGYEKVIDLLIALKPKGEDRVWLFRSEAASLKEVATQDVIGCGDVIRYVAHSLYRDNMPMSQAVTLGVHLVSLAKKHVDKVGGETNILEITSDGRLGWERIEDSERQERFLDRFNEALKEITLLFPDTSIPNDEVFQKLAIVFARLKELREQYFDEAIQSDLIQAITDPDGFQGHTYEHFRPGTMFRIGSEAMRVYEDSNREDRERAQREHEAQESNKESDKK